MRPVAVSSCAVLRRARRSGGGGSPAPLPREGNENPPFVEPQALRAGIVPPTGRFHGAGRKGGSPPGPPVRNPGGRVPSPKGVTIRCRVRWLAPDRGQGGNGHAKFGRDLGPRRYAVQTFFEATQAADG